VLKQQQQQQESTITRGTKKQEKEKTKEGMVALETEFFFISASAGFHSSSRAITLAD